MPRYDYRCRACGDTFEVTRSITAASDTTACPNGHDDTVKLLSTVALTGRGAVSTATRPAATSAGCCGGSCGCS